MDHFQGITPKERYDNDLLNEIHRNNQLLEQIAQLLKLVTPETPKGRKPRSVKK